ncbi:hypothetical protein GUITHDRAFT_114207 [Guillardia theta CCMP2712]|uniref:Uncharacterized protein n=1 Tax=Guillardia theta (strain CCMP2712) TaxID=905079 RepID=L1ITW8_GUITC|nr:hypothetical protein GUITHDRAFT_114207 [Guillardia theta CCMP2712]EKX39711.1 hypothetical protein GUITHDRAFT_114207 [Guillardia theta CCMP2712]|eukprot:XP_005826691.1 hypothetical protein GUITHDRAFT_114207 [Guillardia theta CCMP2712]
MLPFNLAVLEQIYLKFHEFLDWFAGKVQKQDEDTAVLKQIFWSLMNQRLLYADDSKLDERNCRGTIRILETPNNKFYCCQMGKMTLFINGVESGQIPISFPLNLLRIGTASDSSPDDFFCGSIRELHVFDKEKNGEEIFGMINKGMSSGIGHLFSIEFGNKVSDKLLQYGKMRLEISHACKKPMKQRKSELVPLETHWLYEFTKEINALAVRHALLLFRGNNESEEEQLCNKWLNSLLFAQDDVYFQMLQPRIGVRLSTELDRLERSIIVNSPSNQVELCCRCASIAARNIRRHVMQTKDFYNQSALIEENDNGWDKFCSPILKSFPEVIIELGRPVFACICT